jgi:TPR repeat protein
MKHWQVAILSALFFVQPAHAGFFEDTSYLAALKADENGDYASAYKRFVKLAGSSDRAIAGNSAFKLYEYYDSGRGVPKDSAIAIRYLKQVTTVGDTVWRKIAFQKLAMIYEVGATAIAPDRSVAYSYALEAQKLGGDMNSTLQRLSQFPEVTYQRLIDRYSANTSDIAPAGIESALREASSGNFTEAEKIFLWHAKRGNSDAQYAMSLILRTSDDVASRADAIVWGYLSARNGVAAAQREYGEYLIRETYAPLAEAYSWLERAAAQGDGKAAGIMGDFRLISVKGVQPDARLAAKYFTRAVEMGDVASAVRLADLYYQGLGVTQNKLIAYQLYQEASRAGELSAKAKLIALFPAGKPSSDGSTLVSVAGINQLSSNVKTLTPVELYEIVSRSVHKIFAVSKKEATSQGSAVAITSRTVVTNCHVTTGSDAVGTLINGEVAVFTPQKEVRAADLCVYAVENDITPISTVRSFESLKVGERVYAVGSPSGLDNTFSEGVISGLREDRGIKYIQTTAPISPGSSGGGLFDEAGRLIGITTKGLTTSGNINFAVSMDML